MKEKELEFTIRILKDIIENNGGTYLVNKYRELQQQLKDLKDENKEKLEEASWKFNPLKKLDGEFLRHAFKEGVKSDAAKEYWYKIFKSE